MMIEREQYLKEEQAQEQEFINAVRNVQTQQEAAAEMISQTLIGSRDWDAEESYMLAKIAMAEAEGEDTEGKALVILVVLNRVWSDGFPDSIEEVITEPGQFSPVTEGGRYYTTEPDEDCWTALSMVMHGWDESQGATYFTSSEEKDTWHSRNLTKLFEHGNHTFYKEGQEA
ncbi:MAG TPA: cell wall hydrolase [Candidatus Mediterraneibacter surreyensis]|nr:cell wall hydrolase [Candidatus Mediterraneibacter surreyensis]